MKKEYTEKKTRKGCGSIIILLVFVGTVLLTIGIPLLIDYAFEYPNKIIMVAWGAEATLGYYGDVLGFLGTVIFSGLALWQNHVIKTESDKQTKLLENMERMKNMPYIYFDVFSSNGKASNLKIRLRNISDNIATNVKITDVQIINADESVHWTDDTENGHEFVHCARGFEGYFQLGNGPLENVNQKLTFNLSLEDKFGDKHFYTVEGEQEGTSFGKLIFTTKDK